MNRREAIKSLTALPLVAVELVGGKEKDISVSDQRFEMEQICNPPPNYGNIVGIVTFQDELFVACQYGMFKISALESWR